MLVLNVRLIGVLGCRSRSIREQEYVISAVSVWYDLIDDLSEQVRADNDILCAADAQFGIAAIPGQEPLSTIRSKLYEALGRHQIQRCTGIIPQEIFERYTYPTSCYSREW